MAFPVHLVPPPVARRRADDDRLARAKRVPGAIERAVRSALYDVLERRLLGAAGCPPGAFVSASVAALRREMEADVDAVFRARVVAATRRVARTFARSPLYRRLMSVPVARLVRLNAGTEEAEVLVRDARRRLHAVVIVARGDALAAAHIADRIAATTALPAGQRLTPLTIHVFSLVAGTRHAFVRDAARPATASRVA